ncbi:hypothetical protein [Natronosalvus rutilus]|uniref:Uncharacterized protein n=1 Tax=Natronosalvus rutilus TaxID=2953753 RepID=A0A9E7NAL4_9EURY|nr:hypothetical protein [Natronosalvus rutilus]UTF53345.1 hypothetical protein NGM29_16485 [Natronosalvus rutilus]
MNPRSPAPRSTRSSTNASYASGSSRPLGISIICVLGGLGFLFAWIPILQLLAYGGVGTLLAFVFTVVNVGMLAVLVGLWNMEGWALTWALVLYGLSALLDLVTLNVIGLLISLVILAYLLSVSDQFA